MTLHDGINLITEFEAYGIYITEIVIEHTQVSERGKARTESKENLDFWFHGNLNVHV
jgi:hypothetical protein